MPPPSARTGRARPASHAAPPPRACRNAGAARPLSSQAAGLDPIAPADAQTPCPGRRRPPGPRPAEPGFPGGEACPMQ